MRKTVTPLEVAEHILGQAASGERDLDRLKSSAFDSNLYLIAQHRRESAAR
jgi:hypothetical protein